MTYTPEYAPIGMAPNAHAETPAVPSFTAGPSVPTPDEQIARIANLISDGELAAGRMTILTSALLAASASGACADYAESICEGTQWNAPRNHNRSIRFQLADNILDVFANESTMNHAGSNVLELIDSYGVEIGSKVGVDRNTLIDAARDKWSGFMDDSDAHAALYDLVGDESYLERFDDLRDRDSVRDEMIERYADYQVDQDLEDEYQVVGDWVIEQ
jgi:hypothetical protein